MVDSRGEILNNGDLLDMLAHIQAVTGKPLGIKAVLGGSGWIATLFAEIRTRGEDSAPDFIASDGGACTFARMPPACRGRCGR